MGVKVRSLIVEDSRVSRTILKRHLSQFGECIETEDGLTAVTLFAGGLSDDQSSRYDLVCLDLELPDIHGLDVLARIRRTEEEQRAWPTKVLIVTANADQSTVEKGTELRADGYLLKPIEPRKLNQLLQNFGLVIPRVDSVGSDPTRIIGELCDADLIPGSVLAQLMQRMAGSLARQLQVRDGRCPYPLRAAGAVTGR